MCTVGNVILEDIALCVYYKIIRASLSELLVPMHVYVCLLGLTSY